MHFFHHPVTVGFDGALGRAQRVADLLVGMTANDKLEDLPLARRQRRKMPADDIEPVPCVARRFMMRDRPLDSTKQLIGRYRLGQNIVGTRLDCPYGCRRIRFLRKRWTSASRPAQTAPAAHPDQRGIAVLCSEPDFPEQIATTPRSPSLHE